MFLEHSEFWILTTEFLLFYMSGDLMKVYAIGDLHLSLKNRFNPVKGSVLYKPMDLFGTNWDKHDLRVYKNWIKKISRDDLVLIPGDVSWADSIEEMTYDLDYLASLPGKKVFIRGNHDYWWQGINKMREVIPEDCYLLQNDSITFSNVAIAGSRGWTIPNTYQFNERDEKVYKRELIRLEMSLQTLPDDKEYKKIAMTHYMPVNDQHNKNEIICLLNEYDIDICIYGHLHGEDAHQIRIEGEKWGIKFYLVSSDFINFDPIVIMPE